MTQSATALLAYAQLSQASYVNLDGVAERNQDALGTAVKDLNLARDNRFFDPQATAFTDAQTGWSLVDHRPDDLVGMSATLFVSNGSGEFVRAVRGTQASSIADIAADFLGIALAGKAREQLISLYRYYKQLTTNEQDAVVYTQSEKLMLAGLYSGAYSPLTTATAYATISALVANDKGTGELWDDNTSSVLQTSITGHSLGGHLAALLGQMIGDAKVGHVYTFNAPGIGGIRTELQTWMGQSPTIPASKHTNVIAQDGLSLAAGLGQVYGEVIHVDIESTGAVSVPNHYMTRLTDALSVQVAFEALAPALPRSDIETIIKAAAPTEAGSLEGALDALRAALLGVSMSSDAALRTPLDNRESLHANLSALQSSSAYATLRGSTAIEVLSAKTPGEIAVAARQQFGHFIALQTLSPFALLGAASVQASANAALHAQWSADQAISATQDSERTYTDRYLADRAGLLTQIGLHNSIDGQLALRTADLENVRYQNLNASGAVEIDLTVVGKLAAGGNGAAALNPIKITFGSEAADTITGGEAFKGDRLYGGAGADQIAGGLGNDYLEGGAGIDILRGEGGEDDLLGGEGADEMYGGTEADRLTGGAGDDRLEGGTGLDTYIVGAGRDTIVDEDGLGVIKTSAGTQLAGVFIKQGGQYVWANDTAVSATQSGGTLTVQLGGGASVEIRDFVGGKLGLSLAETGTIETGRTILGDLQPEDDIDEGGADAKMLGAPWYLCGLKNMRPAGSRVICMGA